MHALEFCSGYKSWVGGMDRGNGHSGWNDGTSGLSSHKC